MGPCLLQRDLKYGLLFVGGLCWRLYALIQIPNEGPCYHRIHFGYLRHRTIILDEAAICSALRHRKAVMHKTDRRITMGPRRFFASPDGRTPSQKKADNEA